MMNYTNPYDEEHEDSPQDWLNSALVFSQAIGTLLNENEGIVVELQGDAKNIGYDKVIVFNSGGQIIIDECDPGLNHGQRCLIFNENPN
jgi:hypothetical protein